jgi:hypothetical protein
MTNKICIRENGELQTLEASVSEEETPKVMAEWELLFDGQIPIVAIPEGETTIKAA